MYMQYMRKTSPAKESDAPTPAVLPADRLVCACATIRRVARQVTQLYDAALAPTSLRLTQYSLLAKLDRRGVLPMTELAAALGMDRTTLTRNLGPLERDGLLALRAAGRGRTKLVTLTERGRRRLRAAFPYWERAQQRFREAAGAAAEQNLAQLADALYAEQPLERPDRSRATRVSAGSGSLR